MEIGLLMAFAVAAAIATMIAYLINDRHRARYTLDTYSRPPGGKPLKSFVCPDCLHRSYAPQHIRDRFCLKCDKSFSRTEEGMESA
jgi:hypothetical protein